VVQRVVGAVVVMGMICLGGILSGWMVRISPAPSDTVVILPPPDSLPAVTSVSVPPTAHVRRSPITPPASFLTDPLVFLSHAPADSLDLLPGIGAVLAARIVQARAARGKFTSWNDVDAVKGIGPHLIARWQSLSARK
jgi:Helix-hairpin-helix motif